MPPATVRPRRPEDVPDVVEVLLRQQPLTRYPLRDPLPFPPEEFVVRPGELAAWVAVVDGPEGPRVAGHVSALAVGDTRMGRQWSGAVGRPVTGLAAVSVLVVDHALTGRGIGTALLDTCEAEVVSRGLTPVLEVVDAHHRAREIYRARGWEEVGTARPSWLPAEEDPVRLLVLRGTAG